jgi:hypothetical protein
MLYVNILALFCVWTKSLKCNDAENKDSSFQSDVKLEDIQVPCQPSGRSSHPVQTPICPLFHPSGQRVISSRRQTVQHHLSKQHASFVRTPTLYRETFVPACSVHTFQQHIRTPISSRTVL